MKKKTPSKPYFVYLLLNNDKPFYAGVSSRDARLVDHLKFRDAKTNGFYQEKDQIILEMLREGRELTWQKIAEGLERTEALKLEKTTIMDFLIRGEPLTNMMGQSEVPVLRRTVVLQQHTIKKLEAKLRRFEKEKEDA